MEFKDKRILFVSPHTDDVELSAGATLARCIREGARVFYLALTATDDRLNLLMEAIQAMRVYGIPEENYMILKFRDMFFPEQRREIMEALEQYRDLWTPDIVFCPSRHDLHQDHRTTALSCLRVFKWTSNIYGYDVSWNMVTRSFNPNYYIQVAKDDLIKKMDVIRCYVSQRHKVYVKELTLEGRARSAGVNIGVEFAEWFESYRMVEKL